jgi:hypothetical protein
MQIQISTSAHNQRVLSKIALLTKSFEISLIELKKTSQKETEYTSDDYRKAAVLNGKRILSKRMQF